MLHTPARIGPLNGDRHTAAASAAWLNGVTQPARLHSSRFRVKGGIMVNEDQAGLLTQALHVVVALPNAGTNMGVSVSQRENGREEELGAGKATFQLIDN